MTETLGPRPQGPARPGRPARGVPRTAWPRSVHEVAKAVVGQDAAVSGLLVAMLCGGSRADGGRARHGQDAAGAHPRGVAVGRDPTGAVHARPDAGRHHRVHGDRQSAGRAELPRRPGLHQPAARRRDQPHAHRRPSRRCSRRWRRGRSRSTASRTRCRKPFLVAATQNPVEYEGTYPLPEAQLDRFLLKVVLPIPERADELEILGRHAAGFDPRDVAGGRRHRGGSAADVEAGQRAVRPVQVSPEVAGYIVDIARATRILAVALARRQPSRRHGAAARRPRVGLALGSRLRDPRRRQVARPRHAGAPARAAPRGRARGRRRRPGARLGARLGAGAAVTA